MTGLAVVYREHTLGVMMNSHSLQVLNSSVLKGAPFFQDSWLFVSDKEIRPARLEDFNTFRVLYHSDYLLK
jgi:hypothetical protein